MNTINNCGHPVFRALVSFAPTWEHQLHSFKSIKVVSHEGMKKLRYGCAYLNVGACRNVGRELGSSM